MRVKTDVAGNSYKSVGRLFSTEGPTPAALPIATESKSCDVCTVAEARAIMLRLADALRVRIEEMTPVPQPVHPSPAPPPPRLLGPAVLAMVGAVAVGAASRCWPRTATAPRPAAMRTGAATSPAVC